MVLVLSISLFTQAQVLEQVFEYVGFSNWSSPQSQMIVSEEKIVLPQNDYAYAEVGEKNWTDYDLKLKLTPKSFGENGVIRLFFRQEFPWNTYSLDITEKKLELTRYDGIWEKNRVLAENKGLEIDKEVELNLQVKDEYFFVYIDGQLALEADSVKYKNGKIVLFSENAAFEAKDCYISYTVDNDMQSQDRGYFPKADQRGGGISHMVLIYGNNGSTWKALDAYPYVGYMQPLEEAGYQIVFEDYLFDSFLFLALRAPDGYAFDSANRGKPARKEEWQWYIDSLFTEGEQLDAFDKAFALVNEQLGEERKAKVYIMIPYPMQQTRDFGAVDNTGPLKFSLSDPDENTKQRFKAIKWYVDQVLERFNDLNPDNLELVGFYWLAENIEKRVPGEEALIKEVSNYLHQQDLKFSWIPYYSVYERREYEKLGFDICIYQPNYMFNKEIPISRLVDAAKEAYRYNLGLEIEADSTALSTYSGRERFYDYLRAGVSFGYMKEATHAYYQENNLFGSAAINSNPDIRAIYDNLYKYIKGTYSEPLEFRR